MNIAFDAGAIEVGKGSGIGNYTLNQFKSLVQQYPEHSFFYFNMIEESDLTDCCIGDNFHREYYYPGKNSVLREYNGAYQDVYGDIVRNFIKKNKIDVFYITAPFLTSSDIGYNAIYKKEWFGGICVVATCYDIIPYIMRKIYLSSKEAFNWYMSCIEMIKWTDRHLVISNSVKEDMVKHLDFNPEKIDVIHGGVSEKYKILSIAQSEKDDTLSKWNIDSDIEFFLCGVSADQRKNTKGIIKAYSLLPADLRKKCQMVIAGSLDDRQKHEDSVSKLGVKGHVILTDYLSNDDDLIKLYNLAKFVVKPSLYEGFGLPVVEAWACGKAVLASNNSSLGEIVGEAGLLFDPYDVHDMARALREAITSADLDNLAKLGREKLSFYQWNNVAKLSMQAINKAFSNKGWQTTYKERVACVFIRKKYFTDTWKNFFGLLFQTHQLDIFLDDFESEVTWNPNINIYDTSSLARFQTQYTSILYFTTIPYLNELTDTSRYPKGTWIIIDSSMRRFLEIITGVNDEEGLGSYVSEFFVSTPQVLEVFSCNHIIVSSANLKNELLKKKDLVGKVYCISPVLEYYANTPRHVNEKLAVLAMQNFISALDDERFIHNPEFLMETLKAKEIIANGYTQSEVIKFSSSIGFALSTDCIRRTASIRKLRSDAQNGKPLKVAMISSWNTKCGIAEYTRYFIENVSSNIDFEVWPNRTNENVNNDDYAVSRLWDLKGDTSELTIAIAQSRPDVVHIQYTEGFFSVSGLVNIIESHYENATIVVSCHNTEFLRPENKQQLDALNKSLYTVHQESDKNKLSLHGIKASRISHIPLGQVAAPKREKSKVASAIGFGDRYPIIGSFGFLFEHKCVYETIEAISMLKEKYHDILYIASNAVYGVNESHSYYDKCQMLIRKLALEDQVKMVSDFIDTEESLYLLQACDLLVMPYANTRESASGAVRFCVASCRPLVLSDQPIFSDMKEYAVLIKDSQSSSIMEGIEYLLEESRYKRYTEAVNTAAQRHNWQDIEKQYLSIYNKVKSHEEIL